MSSPADDFKPSANVQQGHIIAGTSFDTLVQDPMAYAQRAGGIIGLLFALGVLSQFFLAWGLIFRCCCKSCKCLPKGLDQKSHEERMLILKNRQFYWNISFLAICLSVLIVDCVIFLGSDSFQKGIVSIGEGLDAISDFIGGFEDALEKIGDSSKIWQDSAGSSAEVCRKNLDALNYPNNVVSGDPLIGIWTTFKVDDINQCGGNTVTACYRSLIEIGILLKLLPDLFDVQKSTMNSFSGISSNLSDFLHTIRDYISEAKVLFTTYASQYKDLMIYVVFALALISVVFFLLFRLCRFTCGLQTTMFFSFIILFLICLLNVLWLTFTLITADYCMNPAGNIINAVGNGSTADTLRFYFYNQGQSKIQNDIEKMRDKFKSATDKLDEVNSYKIKNDNDNDGFVDSFSVTQCNYAQGAKQLVKSNTGTNCGSEGTTSRKYAFVRTSDDTSDPDPDYGHWDSCTTTSLFGGVGGVKSTCNATLPVKNCGRPNNACRGTKDSVAIVSLCGNPSTNPYVEAGKEYKDLEYSHGSYYTKKIKKSATDIYDAIGDVKNNLGYEKLHNILVIFIQDAICTEFYDGVYYVWISQTTTGLLLWFAILITSYVYHYFPSSHLMKVYMDVGTAEEGIPMYTIAEGEPVPGTYLEDGTYVDIPYPDQKGNNTDFDNEYNYVDQENTNTDNYFDSNIRSEIDKSES